MLCNKKTGLIPHLAWICLSNFFLVRYLWNRKINGFLNGQDWIVNGILGCSTIQTLYPFQRFDLFFARIILLCFSYNFCCVFRILGCTVGFHCLLFFSSCAQGKFNFSMSQYKGKFFSLEDENFNAKLIGKVACQPHKSYANF